MRNTPTRMARRSAAISDTVSTPPLVDQAEQAGQLMGLVPEILAVSAARRYAFEFNEERERFRAEPWPTFFSCSEFYGHGYLDWRRWQAARCDPMAAARCIDPTRGPAGRLPAGRRARWRRKGEGGCRLRGPARSTLRGRAALGLPARSQASQANCKSRKWCS